MTGIGFSCLARPPQSADGLLRTDRRRRAVHCVGRRVGAPGMLCEPMAPASLATDTPRQRKGLRTQWRDDLGLLHSAWDFTLTSTTPAELFRTQDHVAPAFTRHCLRSVSHGSRVRTCYHRLDRIGQGTAPRGVQ